MVFDVQSEHHSKRSPNINFCILAYFMHLVASVRPFVHVCVCVLSVLSPLNRVQQRRIIIVKFEAKKTITSLRYLSVSVNLGAFAANFADAVDRLLMIVIELVLIISTLFKCLPAEMSAEMTSTVAICNISTISITLLKAMTNNQHVSGLTPFSHL